MRLPFRLGLCAMLLAACGTPAPVPEPTVAPSVPGWSLAPSTSEPPAGSAFDLDAALELIERSGFTPDVPAQPLTGPMRAIHAICTGSANGRCQQVFVFDGQRLAGEIGGLTSIVEQNGTEVVIEFAVYLPGDPGCCPSGQPQRRTYRLVDGQVREDPPR
jgi:LppP/LprE lipoprotein